MRVRRFHLVGYRLPLARPLAVRGASFMHRDGALLIIESQRGATGYGDIAPLPGVSDESLDAAVEQVRVHAGPMCHGDVAADAFFRGPAWSDMDLVPSARCAIESAWLTAMAAEAGLSLAQVLSDEARDVVRLNCLLEGDSGRVVRKAKQAMALGYTHLKVKVGRGEVEAEADLVRRIHAVTADGARIRLDANRSWTPTQFRRFAEGVGGVPIEYIEEPVSDLGELKAAIDADLLPVALDESLYGGREDVLDEYEGAVAAVIKPTRLGGLVASVNLARAAERRGMKPVVSSIFESGIGLRALAALAAGVGGAEEAHGLDTGAWFRRDVVEPGLVTENGGFRLGEAADSMLILCRDVIRDTG